MHLGTLKNPNTLAVLSTRLVPPTQPDEPAPSNVLAVVEVGREEEDHNNEDQDTVHSARPPLAPANSWRGGEGQDAQVGREPEAEEVGQQRSFTPPIISTGPRQPAGEPVEGCT